ncbi:unnamed protein product [Amoebophrya sp. A120]|nr:unnamed protein product [Amoebophrya sp. A120]|eukprot:GSA120T00005981001.1
MMMTPKPYKTLCVTVVSEYYNFEYAAANGPHETASVLQSRNEKKKQAKKSQLLQASSATLFRSNSIFSSRSRLRQFFKPFFIKQPATASIL